MHSLLFLAYTDPNVVLRATNAAFWVLVVLCRAREQSSMQGGNRPARSCAALAGALGRSTARSTLLPGASHHQGKKLPKLPLTMWDWVLCLTFQTRSVFLDVITTLKHRVVWESHLDGPWPVNELRTAQWLCAIHTWSLSRSSEQPPVRFCSLATHLGTLFQHYFICLELTEVRCPMSSSPFTAQL